MKNKHCWLYNIFIMRRLTISLIVICLSISCFAQMRATVDERMELTSIVFRIAGAEEFVNDQMQEYGEAIDRWFGKYSSHELIDHIRKMRQETALAMAGVVGSVPYLVIDGKGVHDSGLKKGSEIDGRWTDSNWDKYVRLLDDFYRKSRFHEFFESRQDFYRGVENGMNTYLSQLDTAWFRSFFGHYDEPVVYVAAANGFHNYYLNTSSIQEGSFAIAIGYPGPWYDPTEVILHEMCHQYTNRMDRFYPEVESAMLRIFENPELVLKYYQNHYGDPEAIFYEWLTNLCVAMYMKEHTDNLQYKVQELNNFLSKMAIDYGFVWMERSMQFMDNFYADRESYPVFEAYMPRICEFMNNIVITENWLKVLEETKPHRPYITNIYPVDGSCLLDYEKVDAVRVTFSQPMMNAHGIKEILPIGGNIFNGPESYWEDSVTYVLPLLEDAVIKDTTYVITLNKDFFIGAKYTYTMEHDYQIIYRKKDKQQ